mgnify:CR=1 FL=1
MRLKIEWCTELYPSKEEENFGEAGDFAVVRLDELRRWLEAQSKAIGNSFINCDEINAYRLALDHLLAELKEAQP